VSGEWASILVAIAIYEGRAGSGQWIIEERPGALSPVGLCTGNRGIGETGADLC
jgi:hypothetical protein